MNIQKVNSINAPHLESQLSYVGLDSWMNFVHEIYQHKIHRFVATENNHITGALSLAEIKHPIFGHYLSTAPFGNYGGVAFQNESARNKLLESAKQLAVEIEAEYISIRFDESASSPPDNWLTNPIYQTYLIDLTLNPDELLKKFSSDHRNHIRKSLKKNFQIRFGHLDLLDDTYEAIAKSMHELGSPYHAKKYLQTMAEYLGEALQFAVTYDSRGKITGGGVFIYQDKTIFNLHANILHFARSNYAGEFLYWSVIEHAMQKGFSTFDLGRSLIGSGNDMFKSKWAPQKKLLSYWYWLAKGNEIPSLNQKSPKFQLAIAVWKRLPSFVVRLIGPYLIRGLV